MFKSPVRVRIFDPSITAATVLNTRWHIYVSMYIHFAYFARDYSNSINPPALREYVKSLFDNAFQLTYRSVVDDTAILRNDRVTGIKGNNGYSSVIPF